MANEQAPAAEATAKPAEANPEANAQAAPAATAKPAEQKEASPAEVPNKADSQVQGDAKNASTDAAQKPEDKPVVPEKYDLKLSKGSLLDASEVQKVEAEAKAKGLTQEQAQERLSEREVSKKEFFSQQQEVLKNQANQWRAQAETDSEIGGKSFKENVEHAHRALNKFFPDSVKKFLDETGYGNHPDIIRGFARVGKIIANDKLVTDGQAMSVQGDKRSIAQNLYGKTHNKG